jgi:hypothetical protein
VLRGLSKRQLEKAPEEFGNGNGDLGLVPVENPTRFTEGGREGGREVDMIWIGFDIMILTL